MSTEDFEPIWPVPNGADPTFRHFDLGMPSATWGYVDAEGRLLFYIARFETPTGKEIRPHTYGRMNGHTGWEWVGFPDPRPLYGLDRLAQHPSDPVLIVEGEKTCDAAVKLVPDHVVTTWPGGAAAIGKVDWTVVQGREVTVWPDNDEPGFKAAQRIVNALQGIVSSIRVVRLPDVLPKGWDLADEIPGWAEFDVAALIKAAPLAIPTDEPEIDHDDLVIRARADQGAPFESEVLEYLAALKIRDPAEWERLRARLKGVGIRVSALDQEIARRELQLELDDGHSNEMWPGIEPWSTPVDGAELLDNIKDQIGRFVILSDHEKVAGALWVLHTYVFDAAFHSPRLSVTSPTIRCGKSTLLRVLARMVPRPAPGSSLTPSVVFRIIEKARPTLLIDEADTFLRDNEPLKGVINSSHCRLDAYVWRNVPTASGDYDAKRFSTWAPMAISAVGDLAISLADRSITIKLQRKPHSQTVERIRIDRDQGFGEIQQKAVRWTADNLEPLGTLDPVVPEDLNDRQADNWRPLLAIANAAGGAWPNLARDAALSLSSTDAGVDDIGVRLLEDLKAVWPDEGQKRIHTGELLHRLHQVPEAPWSEYGRARQPISDVQFARLLKPYGIKSKQLWIGKLNRNGFVRRWFEPLWNRYLR